MQRMNIECPQNMLLIRCQKNDRGQAFSRQRSQHLKTVHSGHLNVEEHNIRRSFQNSLHCRLPISAFPDDLNISEFAKPENDAAARQRLVVDDQSTHGETSCRFRVLRNGNSSTTSQPPASGHPSENSKSAP